MGREIFIYKLYKNKENEELIEKMNSDDEASTIWDTFMESKNLENRKIELLYTSHTKSFANEFITQLGEFEYQFEAVLSEINTLKINSWFGMAFSSAYFDLFLDYLILLSFLIVELENRDLEILYQDLKTIKLNRGQIFVEKVEYVFHEFLKIENSKTSSLYVYSWALLEICSDLKQFTKEDNSNILILNSQ